MSLPLPLSFQLLPAWVAMPQCQGASQKGFEPLEVHFPDADMAVQLEGRTGLRGCKGREVGRSLWA